MKKSTFIIILILIIINLVFLIAIEDIEEMEQGCKERGSTMKEFETTPYIFGAVDYIKVTCENNATFNIN